jgi:hypothetical protein
VPFTPADPAVSVTHLHDDRLEFGEGSVGENIRPDERKAHPPQGNFLQSHYSSYSEDEILGAGRVLFDLNAARCDCDQNQSYLDATRRVQVSDRHRRQCFTRHVANDPARLPMC